MLALGLGGRPFPRRVPRFRRRASPSRSSCLSPPLFCAHLYVPQCSPRPQSNPCWGLHYLAQPPSLSLPYSWPHGNVGPPPQLPLASPLFCPLRLASS